MERRRNHRIRGKLPALSVLEVTELSSKIE